jgi:putative ABC transport system permease protein
VSERFWRRVAAGDPASVGRRLTWAGGDRTLLVIGVAPAECDYPLGTDIWVPIARFFDATTGPTHMRVFDIESRRFAQFELIGRLARGVSLDQLQAELAVLERRWHAQFPDDHRLERVVVTPLLDTVVGNGRQVLLFLFGAAGLVFVIAAVNVAALLLMRASDRQREMAIRLALGASHTRLARQTMAEGLLLGALGALCGLLFAQVFLGIVRWLAPTGVPRIEQATIDVGVLAFCVAAASLWVLALGTVPVWGYRSLEAVLRTSPGELSFRGAHGTNGLRLFTIAEVAAAVVVAIGAGLLVRSFMHLQRIDRGFASNNLAVIPLLLPESRYPDAHARLAFYEQLLPHVAAIPGVIAASPLHVGPGSGTAGLSATMMFEGQTPEEADKNPWASWEPVTPSYFRTLGIPIVRGRGFTDGDGRDGAPVAIVSEAVARRYWPGQDPLGKRLQFTREMPWVTVVGVTADLRYRELTRTWLTVYFPAAQFFFFSPNSLVVRTASAPELLGPVTRQTIRAQEPHVAVESITTMDALLARELSRPRTALTVAAVFAMMAIVLAAVGVYGVLSYEVRQRWRELAIRSALGASPAAICRAVLRRSLTLGGIGAGVGLVASSLLTRSLRSLLFEIRPTDPGMFLAATGTLLSVVLLASYPPARRAAGADPAAALRSE